MIGSVFPIDRGPEMTTETLAGTLACDSWATEPFLAADEGEVTVTLTSVDPAVTIGLAIGRESNGVCSPLTSNDAATSGTALSADVEDGSFCVSVYDAGQVWRPVSYRLSIVHP